MKRENYFKNLEVPTSKVDVVIDTDTFNEVDDQFALCYLLASADKLNLKEIYAAPFFNHHSVSPKDGMEKSYEEILRLLEFAGKREYIPVCYKGATGYLPDEKTPVVSDAAEHLASLAMQYTEEEPLYVITIGAITNIASALLMKPEIADRIVVVWLGGHSHEFCDTKEFNMYQDIAAARVVFGSGAPIVQLPCMGIVSAFTISVAELDAHLVGKSPLCDFLSQRVKDEVASYSTAISPTRAIWDVTAVAWLLNEGNRFMLSRLDHMGVPEYDGLYAFDRNRLMRYVYYIQRDNLVHDLFTKLLSLS